MDIHLEINAKAIQRHTEVKMLGYPKSDHNVTWGYDSTDGFYAATSEILRRSDPDCPDFKDYGLTAKQHETIQKLLKNGFALKIRGDGSVTMKFPKNFVE